MKIVFAGTPEFALPSLEKLVQDNDILCVITQPDRPGGRGMSLVPSPVKSLSVKLGIPVIQPDKIAGSARYLEDLKPDVVVVVAYGQILNSEILKIPKFGCVNLHASLLPELRGPEPIAWSIILGKEKTGLTTMWMDEGVDTGDIIFQKETEILSRDTKGSLEKKMSAAGADLLCETLKSIEAGNAPRIKQEGRASGTKFIKKTDCLIDWSKPAVEIHNIIRGLNPLPAAHTFIGKKRFKVYASLWERNAKISKSLFVPGEIIDVGNEGIFIATGQGTLVLTEVQPEGKKIMPAKDFLLGHPLKKGVRLGE